MSKKFSNTLLRRVISENGKNMSNKLLSSVLGLAMLGSVNSAFAQVNNLASISCPDDITIECGQNIQNLSITGTPSVQLFVGASFDLVSSDAVISSNDCATTIARTWTAELNELGSSLGSVSCVQVITILDTQPPVISGIPESTTVDCVDDVPLISVSSPVHISTFKHPEEPFRSMQTIQLV